MVARSWARGLAPRTHFRPCRENSHAHLGATAHRRPPLPPGSSHLIQADLQSSGWRLQTQSRTCRPAGSALTSGEAATQPGSPGPAARNDISPLSWRGARSPGMQEGPQEVAAQGAGVSPSFFFPPKSQLARCPSGTSCARLLTHPRQHCAETRLPGERVSANRSAQRACGGMCVGGAAAPGRWRDSCRSSLRGFRWSLRTCGWLSVCLPLPAAAAPFSFLSLPSFRLSLPQPAPSPSYPLSSPCCLSWRMEDAGDLP